MASLEALIPYPPVEESEAEAEVPVAMEELAALANGSHSVKPQEPEADD